MTPASPRPARGTREDRREALVRAAFNQIAEHGFEGLRTREVAAEVGMNIATLHYYFPTKEALIRGVVAHAMQRFRSTLAPHGSPADQLRNHLRAVRKLLREEPQVSAVMGELALRSARDPSLAQIMRETYDAWHRTLRGLLKRAARDHGTDRFVNVSTDKAADPVSVLGYTKRICERLTSHFGRTAVWIQSSGFASGVYCRDHESSWDRSSAGVTCRIGRTKALPKWAATAGTSVR